jgi:hypothetical protein
MKRRAARTDSNQTEIVDALRKCGASVLSLAPLGNGVGDLLVGARNLNFLLEVKDGSKPPLTPDQVGFHATWKGQIVIVNSVDEALKAIGVRSE